MYLQILKQLSWLFFLIGLIELYIYIFYLFFVICIPWLIVSSLTHVCAKNTVYFCFNFIQNHLAMWNTLALYFHELYISKVLLYWLNVILVITFSLLYNIKSYDYTTSCCFRYILQLWEQFSSFSHLCRVVLYILVHFARLPTWYKSRSVMCNC